MIRVANSSFFLASRTLKNRLLFTLKRLKRPRYLVSALITLIYFGVIFGRNGSFKRFRGIENTGGEVLVGGVMVLTVLIFFVMLLAWAWPGSKAGLQFSEAEIQFLFPAPFSRAHLMFYKWIRNLVGLVITAVVLGYFSGASSFVGVLAVMVALDAYFTLVRCGRARLRLAGVPWLARVVAVLGIAGGAGWFVWSRFLEKLGTQPVNPKSVMAAFQGGFLDFPSLVFFGVPFVFASATSASGVMVRAGFTALTLLIAAASFLIATRIETDFEESSIEASRRKAEQMSQMRGKGAPKVMARKMPAPFRLVPLGHPAVAIVWKNLIAAGRVYVAHVMIVLVIIAPLLAMSILRRGAPELFGVLGMAVLLVSVVLSLSGAALFRNDLRADLQNIDLLRSYPISGPALIAAQVAAPSMLVIGSQTLLAITGGLLLLSSSHDFTWNMFGVLLTLVLLIGAPLNALQVTIQNAWAILLPGWSFVGKEESRGLAGTGQRILIMLGHVLMLAATLALPALAFGISFWLSSLLLKGQAGILSISLIAPSAILVAELHGAVLWLGHRFEDLDLANDDLAPR